MWSLHGETMGTTWSVTWVGEDPGGVRERVEAALDDVDASMSTWRADSDLSRVRNTRGPVPVTGETASVVRSALELAEQTGGAFDPTVQPLVELWGFHGNARDTSPTDEELAAARAAVGYEKVVVTWLPDGRATVDGGGTALDLSAIAKGHAVDRVSGELSELGLASHMVEVGGEVRVQGHGASGPWWRVGVDRPVLGSLPGDQLAGVVELVNGSVATSGNYRNVVVIDGQRLGHTLDARTGLPAESDALSATVLAPDCRTADGWATALMVFGTEGLPLVEGAPQVEALILDREGVAHATSGMHWLPVE